MSLFEAARWAPSSTNAQPWDLFMQQEIQKSVVVDPALPSILV
jgi:hypothetical protein